ASLVWNEGWTREPLKVPVAELEEMRIPAMGLLPQGELANSPTQPLMIPKGTFGPLGGQMIIGEMNQNLLVRFLPEQIGGVSQGAAIPFLQTSALGRGNHRLAFTRDGSLWIGKTHLSWAGANGLVRVRLREDRSDILVIEQVKLVENGFSLRFSLPIDGKTLAGLKVRRHTYKYHAAYGSPKVDEAEIVPTEIRILPESPTVVIKLPDLLEGYVYTLHLPAVTSTSGNPLLGDRVYYTLLRKH
ncbi:MAG: hypothetical protein GWO24_13895, partial [Akkermansiaceae bacterium]|nr:hypothetical protein [Akkermansiaceae bacterium]